jgi:hypothetical protein
MLSAYGSLSSSGRPLFGADERVATGVVAGSPNAAFDPDSDRVVDVWRTTAGDVEYADRRPGG